MNAPSELTDSIIALLVASTEDSRELDCRIFEALGRVDGAYFNSPIVGFTRNLGTGIYAVNTADGYRHHDALRAPLYTASIDAALLLVPEGCWYVLGKGRLTPTEPLYGASVTAPDKDIGDPPLGEGEHRKGMALAICIAALRARQALSDA